MLLQTSFQFNLVTAVKIKHTLHCLYIDLCEESLVFVVVVFKTSMLDWRGVHWSKIGLFAKFGVAVFKASLLYYLWGMGVEQPGDLPRSALTTILHITAGKYEPSLLKFVIVM